VRLPRGSTEQVRLALTNSQLEDHALIFWRYRWGEAPADSVRGVNIMRVTGGQIVEARGYVKQARREAVR